MDPECDVCRTCKSQRARCANKVTGRPDELPTPKAFADSITLDHAIINEEDSSRLKDQVALIAQDRFSAWLQAYAAKSKSAMNELVFQVFHHFGHG